MPPRNQRRAGPVDRWMMTKTWENQRGLAGVEDRRQLELRADDQSPETFLLSEGLYRAQHDDPISYTSTGSSNE